MSDKEFDEAVARRDAARAEAMAAVSADEERRRHDYPAQLRRDDEDAIATQRIGVSHMTNEELADFLERKLHFKPSVQQILNEAARRLRG